MRPFGGKSGNMGDLATLFRPFGPKCLDFNGDFGQEFPHFKSGLLATFGRFCQLGEVLHGLFTEKGRKRVEKVEV